MAGKSKTRKERQVTYTALTGLFMAWFMGFTVIRSRQGKEQRLRPFEFLQLALATYRMGRLISYDKVFEPYRAAFTKTVPDPSGEGMTVVARGTGVRAAIGDLICCPICSGTWVAAGLFYGWNLFPRVTRTFVGIMSAVGAAELLDAATEALQWNGQLAREKGGALRAENQAPSATREQFSVARHPVHLVPDAPRRRFEDREWRRNAPPAEETGSGNGATVPPPTNRAVPH